MSPTPQYTAGLEPEPLASTAVTNEGAKPQTTARTLAVDKHYITITIFRTAELRGASLLLKPECSSVEFNYYYKIDLSSTVI